MNKPKSAEEFAALSWDEISELADAISAGNITLTEDDYKAGWKKEFRCDLLFGDTPVNAVVMAGSFYDIAGASAFKCGLVFMTDITFQQPRTWDSAGDHTNYATSDLHLKDFSTILKQLPEEITKHIVDVMIYSNYWDPDKSIFSHDYISTKLFLPSYSELGGSNWAQMSENGEKWPYFEYAEDADTARKKQYYQSDGLLADTNYFTRSRFSDGDLYNTVAEGTGTFSTYGPIQWGGRLPLCFCMGNSEPSLKNAVSAEQAVELINDGLNKVIIDALTEEDIDQIVLDTLGENAAIPNLPGDSSLFYNGEGEWTSLQVDAITDAEVEQIVQEQTSNFVTRDNIELLISQSKRGGIVGINASTTTKPWFKMLELVDPLADQNRNIVLLVHKINSTADCCGILTINAKMDGSRQWVSGFCEWEYIGAGLEPNDFAYTYSNDSPSHVIVYCRCPGSWICYGFEVLYESIGATRDQIAFSLYNGRLVEGQDILDPNGETIIYSKPISLRGVASSSVNEEQVIEIIQQYLSKNGTKWATHAEISAATKKLVW